MALLIQRVIKGLTPWLDADRTPPVNNEPEKIVLGVRPGYPLSDRPPVRIFLGTERNQFRAERVFLWSVEKCRDPGRVYEIYLLKGLAGYGGRFWLTGFTNYRFAIPHYCGYQGRAIYNDVDQVYLRDPAELFDQSMGESGFLAISDRDTSVMLIDCARMRTVWTDPAIFRSSRKQLEAAARADHLWGPMDPQWNARDAEYRPDQSALVHFTTLHTQPWRPFPGSFVYFDNPTGSLWPDLEREADEARFQAVTATRPTRDWPRALAALTGDPADGASEDDLRALLGSAAPAARATPLTLRSVDWLSRVPDGDLSWVLARLFEHSEHAGQPLTAIIDEPVLISPETPRRSGYFWLQHFQRASALYPGVRWQLRRKAGLRWEHHHGGPAAAGTIRVLAHRKPGHTNQARSLASALGVATGRAVEEIEIPGGDWVYVVRRLLRLPLPAALRGAAPVLIASGWLPCRYARWIARQQDGRPALVLMGRKAGRPPEHGGVAVNCQHFDLPPHPNLIHTLLPLNAPPDVAPGGAAAVAGPWQKWLEAPKRVAVLVGGPSRSYRFRKPDAQALARGAVLWAQRQGAELLVITSRRTARQLSTLEQGVGDGGQVYRWRPADPANPYSLALRSATALMVTGESESMLADALHSGNPVTIWRLPRKVGLWARLSQAVAIRATQPRLNRRGSIRPQQGLTYLCARLLAGRWILPERNLDQLHDHLLLTGAATLPGDVNPPAHRLVPEVEAVARDIAVRLRLGSPAAAARQGRPQTISEGAAGG
jgi:uncharacterized protein